ncbi:hypothetical protein [Rhodoplanes roseus]|uniref:Spermidine synthase n=1 Tax=Rhodoplanes roseus TaxID=29409 RepID=A0A327L252_9BRAD|nr:hypothetical protein [Rhodoplanes roseus]RAI45160.1 hypothetical protein CH341_05555 [Rhodoplanes roseus]
MIPWTLRDSTDIPEGGTLRLMQRGAEFSIMLGSVELMNSRRGGSEEALGTLACQRMFGRTRPEILIGGLGMGFTLRAALAALADDAHITVAELVPAVVAWARGPMAEVFRGCLDDPRVAIVETDVGRVIRSARTRFDAILLDVDNGPDGLSRTGNDGLYDAPGLAAASTALRPGGVLAVWSARPDKAFGQRLRRAGFAVDETSARSRTGRGARHVIWLAAKPAAA